MCPFPAQLQDPQGALLERCGSLRCSWRWRWQPHCWQLQPWRRSPTATDTNSNGHNGKKAKDDFNFGSAAVTAMGNKIEDIAAEYKFASKTKLKELLDKDKDLGERAGSVQRCEQGLPVCKVDADGDTASPPCSHTPQATTRTAAS